MEEYYIGNKRVMINFAGLKRINGGMEGDVYQYKKGILIKKFHSNRPGYLWPIEEKRLKGIGNVNLKLIGLPLNLVYDESRKNVVGYTMRQFYDLVSLYRMHNIRISNVIKMLKEFENEVRIMSFKAHVVDIKTDSILYSKSKKKLCLLDSSGYSLLKDEEDARDVFCDNIIKLNEVIIHQLLLSDGFGNSYDLDSYDLPECYVSVYSDGCLLSDVLEQELKRTGCYTIKALREFYRNEMEVYQGFISNL